MTSVLVTSGLTRPGRPVRGTFSPFSAGLFRTLSAVSPCAMCQRISHLFKSIALMRAYGGLRSGSHLTLWHGTQSAQSHAVVDADLLSGVSPLRLLPPS